MGLRARAAAPLLVALALAYAPAAGAQVSLRIVAFGDSLTAGFGDETGRGGYPSRLQALLAVSTPGVTVDNQGVDGEKTPEGLTRMSTLSGSAADSLILMEGTNDSFTTSISTETTIANLRAMVSRARQRGFGKVYLATVPPIGQTSSGPRFSQSAELSDAIRQAAYEDNLPMPDPHQAFYDIENFFDNLYIGDGIHPNATGYAAMAEFFADYIEGIDSVAPAPSFVSPSHNSKSVPSDALLRVVLFDPLAGVDQATATLTIDGAAIATTVIGDGRRTELRAQPGNLNGKRLLGVDVSDFAEPVNNRIGAVSQFTAAGTTFVVGDIDENGRVDGADLVQLGFSFGASAGDSRYRSRADLDDNGVVNGSDLARLAANFGRSTF